MLQTDDGDIDLPCMFFHGDQGFLTWAVENKVPRKAIDAFMKHAPVIFKEPRHWQTLAKKEKHPVFTDSRYFKGIIVCAFQLRRWPGCRRRFISI